MQYKDRERDERYRGKADGVGGTIIPDEAMDQVTKALFLLQVAFGYFSLQVLVYGASDVPCESCFVAFIQRLQLHALVHFQPQFE